MSISAKDKQWEEKRLNEVYDKLTHRIHDLEAALQESVARFKNSNEKMWEFGKRELVAASDFIENMPYLESIKLDYFHMETVRKELKKMMLLQRDLYFGRIDFQEQNDTSIEKIYIGKSSFSDNQGEYLVYDWRANICSLFYENELGNVHYDAPDGRISGNMSKKRQFEIFHDEILTMFDSSVMIDDAILKDILSKSKDSKMSNIVETIQKEQNEAIRSTYATVVVSGPAGCGKTSIAMHRAAWLMYKHKNELQNNQIIIFSPNDTFNDYISEVLPELGEDNINMSTFHKLAYEILGSRRVLISKYIELEDILLDNEYADRQDVSIKYSVDFAKRLTNYYKYISTDNYHFSDLIIDGKVIMSKAEFDNLFYIDYLDNDIITRLSKIKLLLDQKINPIIRNMRMKYVTDVKNGDIDMTDGFFELREQTRKIYNAVDISVATDYEGLYAGFLNHEYGVDMSTKFIENLNKGIINARDTAPLIYLRILFGERNNVGNIKHVIIDEIQDYSYIEKLIISVLFRNSHMTLLGDINQKINHYIEDVQDNEIFRNAETIRLNKSYRSTYQIAKFCNDLLDENFKIEYFNRQGVEPVVINSDCGDVSCVGEIVRSTVEDFRNKGHRSIAVITRTDSYSKKLQPLLKEIKVNRVTEKNTSYTSGTVIMPSYLSKGLEFDAVIVLDINEDKFDLLNELSLYYTCCTRALHELCIIN